MSLDESHQGTLRHSKQLLRNCLMKLGTKETKNKEDLLI